MGPQRMEQIVSFNFKQIRPYREDFGRRGQVVSSSSDGGIFTLLDHLEITNLGCSSAKGQSEVISIYSQSYEVI